MSRWLLVAFGLAVASAATAAGHSGDGDARPTTLATVRGSVFAVAQDSRRIAWVRSVGVPVQVLRLPGRRVVTLGSRPSRQGCWRCSLLRPIAIGADGRVLWQAVTDGGNTYSVV